MPNKLKETDVSKSDVNFHVLKDRGVMVAEIKSFAQRSIVAQTLKNIGIETKEVQNAEGKFLIAPARNEQEIRNQGYSVTTSSHRPSAIDRAAADVQYKASSVGM